MTEIPVSECEALVGLYNSTNGDNWVNHDNWGNSSYICDALGTGPGYGPSRNGIGCHSGHVTQIVLIDNNVV